MTLKIFRSYSGDNYSYKNKKYIEKIFKKYHPNNFLDKNFFDRNKTTK